MKKYAKIGVLILLVLLPFLLSGCTSLTSTTSDGPLGGILGGRSDSVKILMLLTVMTVLPSILLMMTGFTRIIIVLSFIKNGLGMQQVPPNQVFIGLALFITFFVMAPVFSEINTTAYQPYIHQQITEDQAVQNAMKPVRNFMLKQTYKKDLDFFIEASKPTEAIDSMDKVSNTVLIPAFITSEIKRGFQIGFFIYIPFIVIDMVVASTLMAMGMMMLPPTVISMPFKVLLFVLVDGWTLTIQSLLTSFGS